MFPVTAQPVAASVTVGVSLYLSLSSFYLLNGNSIQLLIVESFT